MSESTGHRIYSPLAPFDPDDGIVVLGPERGEPGFWTGCPGVLRDQPRAESC